DPVDAIRPLEQIFVEEPVGQAVLAALSAPHGVLLIGGPSGSGKSSTLYSLIHQRKTTRPDHDIVSIENPIEYSFPGITQVAVNPKIGLDYAQILHSVLRQSPDVVMVGELSNAETAGITIEAALRGHLVLAAMHGSSVVAIL